MYGMFGTVERANHEPPALQVYRIVAGAISRGAFGAGSRLPPERELSSQVKVSRATLRVALRALHDDGLIEPAPGRGWHVTASGVLEEGIDAMPLSFTEMAVARHLRPSAEVLDQSTRTATIEEAEDLGIAPGSEVFCLDRLRKLDYTSASLYAALRERCDVHPVRASYVLQAKGATAREADLLGMAEGDAVLVGDYKCYDEQERTFEVGRISYRGDRYRFRASIRDRRASLPRMTGRPQHVPGPEG
jgi:GntR family transcriptional regulator